MYALLGVRGDKNMMYYSVQTDMKIINGYIVSYDGVWLCANKIKRGEKLFKLDGKYFLFNYEATEYALKIATDDEFIAFARDMQDSGRNGFKHYLKTHADVLFVEYKNDTKSAKEMLLKLAQDFAKDMGYNTLITFGEWLSDMRGKT